jgi:hypothetical protein
LTSGLAVFVAATGIAGVSSATSTSVCPIETGCLPLLQFKLHSWASPRALPRGKPAAVGVGVSGRIERRTRRPASALREGMLSVDKDLEVNVAGLSTCGYRRIASRDTSDARRVCRAAVVGSGEATVELAFPGGDSVEPLAVRLFVFNGGLRAGVMRFFIHAFVPRPLKQALVAPVMVEKKRVRKGSVGWRAVVKVPRIAKGYGALTDFRLRLKRLFFRRGERMSFLSARCPDGEFRLQLPKLLFRNEAKLPGVPPRTILRGGLRVPCKAKR